MRRRLAAVLALVALVAAACSDDEPNTPAPTTDSTQLSPVTTQAAQSGAIWPASDVTFRTPEAAAEDFVSRVLDVPPVLGEFQRGDSRSGEIVVFSPGENGTTKVPRSTLLLRQLGAKNGWFVLAATSAGATITSPVAGDTVRAGKVTLSGKARGFEGTVVARAFVVGDDVELTKAVTHGGSFAEPQPYSATLDLSSVPTGSNVLLLVRGDTGLETDPGDFAAVPVVVR